MLVGARANQCKVDGASGGDSACQADDQTLLLQARVNIDAKPTDENAEEFVYGPVLYSITFLDFFKEWSKGSIEHRLSRIKTKDTEVAQIESTDTATDSMSMLAALIEEECSAKQPVLLEDKRVEIMQSEESTDDSGVRHVIVKGAEKLQYLAVHRLPSGMYHALVADPPLCANFGSLLSIDAQRKPKKLGLGKDSGDTDLLTTTDPLVQHCKHLFQSTYVENCGGEAPNITVLNANRKVANGLQVHMRIKVCGKYGCFNHHPDCSYETSTDHTDASLLESSKLGNETDGLEASIKMEVHICSAVKKDGGADPTDALLQQFSFGENSLYLGNEHVYDDMPVYSALDIEVPSELDFRSKYSQCFPSLSGMGPGTETVRNQGTCGSCWAFASATATMANLCVSDVSKSYSFASPSDRFEVSVQQIMSCKPKGKYTADGCSGGNMNQFASEASSHGLTKERDNLYKCGGGNPKKHFSQTAANCNSFPWGGSCSGTANPAWWWGGAAMINGEDSMKSFLANGQALYVSIKVYSNFMRLRGSSIYSYTSGGEEGGHAMACLGYGAESGTKYWLIQNSWGTSGWGDEGYCRFKRGENLAGVETRAFAPRVWVSGGKAPPCQDSAAGSGLTYTGRAPFIPCSKVANDCQGRFGDTVRQNCPKTCGACSGCTNSACESSSTITWTIPTITWTRSTITWTSSNPSWSSDLQTLV